MQLHPPNARTSTPRRWDHLTPEEVQALRPFFETPGPGRPIHDLSARLDAIFWVVCQDGPWRNLPAEMGPWDTAHRQFRRWAHAGVWTRLLKLLARRNCPSMLRRLEHWLCRAFRRALRILKLPGLALAQRLGLLSALPGPWWMLPKPYLSETLLPLILKFNNTALALAGQCRWREVAKPLKDMKLLHRFLGGTTRIPKYLRPA
jgi:transposase